VRDGECMKVEVQNPHSSRRPATSVGSTAGDGTTRRQMRKMPAS